MKEDRKTEKVVQNLCLLLRQSYSVELNGCSIADFNVLQESAYSCNKIAQENRRRDSGLNLTTQALQKLTIQTGHCSLLSATHNPVVVYCVCTGSSAAVQPMRWLGLRNKWCIISRHGPDCDSTTNTSEKGSITLIGQHEWLHLRQWDMAYPTCAVTVRGGLMSPKLISSKPTSVFAKVYVAYIIHSMYTYTHTHAHTHV